MGVFIKSHTHGHKKLSSGWVVAFITFLGIEILLYSWTERLWMMCMNKAHTTQDPRDEVEFKRGNDKVLSKVF